MSDILHERTEYYVIRTNEALQHRLGLQSEDWTCLLEEPVIWSRQLYLDSSDLNLVQTKICFLLDLASEYLTFDGEPETEFQCFIIDLIEYPLIKAETFNKWWTLERFEYLENTFENVESELSKQLIESIQIPSIAGAE